jgi:hypothetical protein
MMARGEIAPNDMEWARFLEGNVSPQTLEVAAEYPPEWQNTISLVLTESATLGEFSSLAGALAPLYPGEAEDRLAGVVTGAWGGAEIQAAGKDQAITRARDALLYIEKKGLRKDPDVMNKLDEMMRELAMGGKLGNPTAEQNALKSFNAFIANKLARMEIKKTKPFTGAGRAY